MAEGLEWSGVVLDDLGVAVNGATLNLYDVDTSTTSRANDTTDANGQWDISHSTEGRFDLIITNGTDKVSLRARDQYQVSTMHARSPVTAEPAVHAMSTTSEASSLVAVFAFRPATESTGVETADTPSDNDEGYINLNLTNDNATPQNWTAARLTWVGVDVSDGSEDGRLDFAVMTAGSLADELQLDGTALSPSTDGGLSLGTTALGYQNSFWNTGHVTNWEGGDVTLTHSAGILTYGGDGTVVIRYGTNVDLSFTGTTGTNDITLTDSLADALSITRASTDMMVFDSNTPNIVITPTVTITGLLTASAGLSAGDNSITNVNDIALDTISADDGTSFSISDDVFGVNGKDFTWGHTAKIAGTLDTGFQIIGSGATSGELEGSLTLATFSSDNADGSFLQIIKSGNITPGSNTTVADNEVIGGIRWNVDDGGDYVTAPVEIVGRVDDASVAASQIGGEILLRTALGSSNDDIGTAVQIFADNKASFFGVINAADSTEATSETVAAVTVVGGVGITKNLFCLKALNTPDGMGADGEQLTSGGDNLAMDWAADTCLPEFKNINEVLEPTVALDALLSLSTDKFTYREKMENGEKAMTTGDFETEYAGIDGRKAPYLMHHHGKIFSAVSAFGYARAAIEALKAEIDELKLQVEAA